MTDLDLLEARLQADANMVLDRTGAHKRYVVFDIEYLYDREGQRRADRHAADPRGTVSNDNGVGKSEVGWPFHRVVCISAMALSVLPGGTLEIETLETWSRPELSETEIVRALGDFAAARSDAIPVTWGGECKDLPALLAVAMRAGFVLPAGLSGPHWKHARLDLCELLKGKAKPVHLNEYAHAQGLPAKLMAPWALGLAAERGKWSAIREHCECDTTVTAMLLVRWLLATGELRSERAALDSLVADTVMRLRPYRPQLLAAIAGFTSGKLEEAA